MGAITEKRDGAISQSAAVSGSNELKAPPLRPAAIAPPAIEIRRFSVIAYTIGTYVSRRDCLTSRDVGTGGRVLDGEG